MHIMKNKKKDPKRILVVSQHYWPESFRINDICDFLISKGCKVDVLCGIPNYPIGKFFEGYSYCKNKIQVHNGVQIIRAFEIPRGKNTNFRVFLNYISFPIASLFHVPRLLTKKYDKVFAFTYSPILMAISGIIIAKIKKVELTIYVLDLWPENLFSVLKIKNRFLRYIARVVSHWHYRQANKLIVMTNAMKKRIIEITNIPNNKIITLPQACEKIYEQNIPDSALQYRFKDKFNILFAGNISPAQSFNTIIAAAKLLIEEGYSSMHWIIVGDGMSRKWLEKQVKIKKLSNFFSFEGLKPMEDIPKYTYIADVLVGCLVKSNLLEATVPGKFTSYIAAGKPIVMAIDGEARTLINETIGCGFAGPTEDSKELANNIKKIYCLSDKERKKMGQKASEYHFKHLERNIIFNKLYGFIFD